MKYDTFIFYYLNKKHEKVGEHATPTDLNILQLCKIAYMQNCKVIHNIVKTSIDKIVQVPTDKNHKTKSCRCPKTKS